MICSEIRLATIILALIAEEHVDRPQGSYTKVHEMSGIRPKH